MFKKRYVLSVYQYIFWGLLGGCLTPLLPVRGDGPTTQPVAASTQAANSAAWTPEEKAKRQELLTQDEPYSAQWKLALDDESGLPDSSKHAALRSELVPAGNELIGIWKEIRALAAKVRARNSAVVPPSAVSVARIDAYFAAWYEEVLIAVEDPATIAAVKARAASPDAVIAELSQFTLLAGQWLGTSDAATREKLTGAMAELVKTVDPKEPLMANVTCVFLTKHPAAVADQHVREALVASYPGKLLSTGLAKQDKLAKDEEILAHLVGKKALVLSGTTADDKPFSTEQWKGKVVLVDFWASWCGPCKAELPHVKAVYQKYHDQGLEVLGVSNDYAKDALTSYLAKDPGLAWPSLFDEKAASDHAWHPLSQKYGIDAIPRMFLIDRNGICRTVEARQNMDELIPKLLAENVAAAN